jgi:hypothetical protein
MWRKKNLIIIAIITVVVIVGVLGGFAMASADDQTTNNGNGALVTGPASANITALLNQVATVYQEKTGQTLDTQALIDSFKQVQKDIRTQALDNYLDKLVAQNKISEDQAQQFKDWLAAKPDVPIGPGLNGGFFGKFRGMMGPGGRFGGMFRGWCGPGNGSGNPSTTTTTPD